MLASHSCFMLLKNSFSESARMSLEWRTVFTSFSSTGDSFTAIQSPVIPGPPVTRGQPVAAARPVAASGTAANVGAAGQWPAPLPAVPSPAAPGQAWPQPGRAGSRPSDPPETFAEWMGSALRREGLTQEAAARQLGVSVKTVSRWVGGATEPRMRDLRLIQEVFGEVPLP